MSTIGDRRYTPPVSMLTAPVLVPPPALSDGATRPVPADSAVASRWQWTSLAYRILYGMWEYDLRERLQRQLGSVRAKKVQIALNLAHNLEKHMATEVSTLYDVAPQITIDQTNDAAVMALTTLVTDACLWPMMQIVQRDTIALREMLLRIDVPEGGKPVFLPVFPQDVDVKGAKGDPSRPVYVAWARLRVDPNNGGRHIWTWDVTDIADLERPVYQIRRDRGGEPKGDDLTEHYLGAEQSGDAYPYRRDGTPFLPFVLYHAAKTSHLFDAWANQQIVEGTLSQGVGYTNLDHLLMQASWAQRNAINAMPVGSDVNTSTTGEPIHEIVVDPMTVLAWQAVDPSAGQPILHQWNAPSDPVAFHETLEKRANSIAAAFLGSNTAQRKGGTPESGYAIGINRDAKRAAQRKFAPIFGVVDAELLWKTATMVNHVAGSNLPESGWGVVYRGIPLTTEERAALLADVKARVEAGFLSPVDAYIELNPGATAEQATAKLTEIAAQRRTFTI